MKTKTHTSSIDGIEFEYNLNEDGELDFKIDGCDWQSFDYDPRPYNPEEFQELKQLHQQELKLAGIEELLS